MKISELERKKRKRGKREKRERERERERERDGHVASLRFEVTRQGQPEC